MSTNAKFQTKDRMVDDAYLPTKSFQDWALAIQRGIPTFNPLFLPDFGASGNGQRNDTAALQAAVNQAVAVGGATIIVPPGTYLLDTVTFPVGAAPITILGAGDSTIFKRGSNLAPGKGMLDILGSNVTLDSILIDGDTTVPVGLFYNADFSGIGANDPMAGSLTGNSSVWLHGPMSSFTAQRVNWRHTGGYAALVDAGSGGISNVRFLGCRLENNRPHLFGFGGAAIFGSWTGGIYINGDGRSTNPGCVLKKLVVAQCQFLRGAGNQIWSHLYGLDELHEDFQIYSNYLLDVGLDAIEIGGVIGGGVIGNSGRRIGYIAVDDTGDSIPRWLANLNATAIDSSGLVKGVLYCNNSFVSVNGGCLDMDGHGDSVVGGNMFRIPYPDEPEYDQDKIGSSGAANAGSTSYGVNVNNSSQNAHGAANLNIVGNTFINLRAGSIRLFAARHCLVTANIIAAPADSIYPPIGMGPVGPGPNQRCLGNKVAGNHIDYSPVAAAPAIFEDDTVAPFVAGESNTVCNNVPITPPGTLATEFQPSLSGSSVHYAETIWFP